MVKKAEKKSSISKKIVIWFLSIIGFLAIVFFVYIFISISSSDENIERILTLEENYISTHDNFFVKEYEVSDPSQVTSVSMLPRAYVGVSEAQRYLSIEKENVTEILKIIDEIKPQYSGDKLDWLNSVQECYTERLAMIGSYNTVLDSELVYFNYYNSSSNFNKNYEEFNIVLRTYLIDATGGDEQAFKNDINNMKTKVSAMGKYAQEAYSVIPFVYYQKMSLWAIKYNEGLDLQLAYLDNNNQATFNQMNSKFDEAGKLIEGLTTIAVNTEFDEWYNSNLALKVDAADRAYNKAQVACDSASNIFSDAFPGNANVIKEVA